MVNELLKIHKTENSEYEYEIEDCLINGNINVEDGSDILNLKRVRKMYCAYSFFGTHILKRFVHKINAVLIIN